MQKKRRGEWGGRKRGEKEKPYSRERERERDGGSEK